MWLIMHALCIFERGMAQAGPKGAMCGAAFALYGRFYDGWDGMGWVGIGGARATTMMTLGFAYDEYELTIMQVLNGHPVL
jgi:hypothetical protein